MTLGVVGGAFGFGLAFVLPGARHPDLRARRTNKEMAFQMRLGATAS
jgi:hypothetical protein